ncbi:Rhamnogalacturonan acetylesterase [Lachnellula arida]|uniref:Rhamnogalacturonan acetylesterase n=1 Tax=Lachnellula arida TaxID=1316785 RepID=A0A8T9BF16_9HELO|nr:Rhamnogalacturonan acetylesterase [Lachnellula arida]
MSFKSILAIAVAGTVAVGAVASPSSRLTPVVYLAGDSTMSLGGGHTNYTQGWGEFLHYSLDSHGITVNNSAVAGTSARSYTREGYFGYIANALKPRDIVVIEFGHNDGAALEPTDIGRGDCPGGGDETCITTFDNVTETVYTYPAYYRNATRLFRSKGATVVLSPPTPNNPYNNTEGIFIYTPGNYTRYAAAVALDLGGPAGGVAFVDHGQYVANIYKELGRAVVDNYFPKDHTHTSRIGATVVSQAFVKALVCAKLGTIVLRNYVINSTESVPGYCI